MKILVVFTGGTIGCSVQNGVLDVEKSGESDYYLISEYIRRSDFSGGRGSAVEFDTIEPLSVLSENMTIGTWNTLIEAFKAIDVEAYDSIIVTHGSDTMAYTAQLFSFLLSGIQMPVFFISSNYSLYDSRSDGHSNFADAVSLTEDKRLRGVFAVFKSKLFIASRIKQSMHFTDEYGTADGEVFAHIENGKLKESSKALNPEIASFGGINRKPLLYCIDKIRDNVLMLMPYVGLNYENIHLHQDIKAVLHGTYHSFTVCADGENEFSFTSFADRCRRTGVKLYLAPFKSRLAESGAVTYASTTDVLKTGVSYVSDMCLESAYVKLLIAYSLYEDETEIQRFLNENVFFEMME